ncbi:MAG: 23S rRNA pseudouridine(2604) synthase RluF [Flavobacteriales bacterium]|nr:23S rRNA pseudouridine(2604) synthase RluF [Flavobacteriales bacterium]
MSDIQDNQKIRLNKFISDTGICSRREADKLIESGKVTVNGELAGLGVRVSREDKVLVSGQPLRQVQQTIYMAFNKPVGIVCTTEKHIKGNIINYIGYPERIFPIGRLDKPSEGLIFLTNDGNIVNKILRAGNAHEKEYVVDVHKSITPAFITQMAGGVRILGTKTKKCKVVAESDKRFRIVLTQGLNRQIRRMCEALGYDVTRLQRTRIMHISLDQMQPGKWRLFNEEEIAEMMSLVAKSSKTEEASDTDVME